VVIKVGVSVAPKKEMQAATAKNQKELKGREMKWLGSTEVAQRGRATTIRALIYGTHRFSLYRERYRAAMIGGDASGTGSKRGSWQ
jgi:hypothetical protein